MKPNFTGQKCLAGLPVAAMFLFSISAHAAPTGFLSVDSCAGQATVTATSIDFNAPAPANPQCIQSGSSTNLTSTFGNLTSGIIGTISDLSGPLPPGGVPFLTFDPPGGTAGNLVFMLTSVGPGSTNTNCGGAGLVVCSISLGANGISPFILVGNTNTTISLPVAGTVSDASGISTWSGTFSSDFAGSPASVANLFNTQGSLTSTFSGRITAEVIPEPGSMALLGAGLLGLGMLARRRASARRS